MNFFQFLSSLLAALTLSSMVSCSEHWCPCLKSSESQPKNSSSVAISPYVCEKYKGVLFSEEREFKCECCLIFRTYKESCKPSKSLQFVVRCEDGLYCDKKHVCKVQQSRQSMILVMKSPQPRVGVSQAFSHSFAEMLRKALTCDCSGAKCDNEVTRQECEDHQGLFVDKLSVRNRCQCCDPCYIPRGHHQSCAHYHKKNVQYVCDTGLYCSPFTHMCIEKQEIFTQFLKKVEKENSIKQRLGVFEEERQPNQSLFVASLNRRKRDDKAAGGEESTTEAHTTTSKGGEGVETTTHSMYSEMKGKGKDALASGKEGLAHAENTKANLENSHKEFKSDIHNLGAKLLA